MILFASGSCTDSYILMDVLELHLSGHTQKNESVRHLINNNFVFL